MSARVRAILCTRAHQRRGRMGGRAGGRALAQSRPRREAEVLQAHVTSMHRWLANTLDRPIFGVKRGA